MTSPNHMPCTNAHSDPPIHFPSGADFNDADSILTARPSLPPAQMLDDDQSDTLFPTDRSTFDGSSIDGFFSQRFP
jgi:hypothetical protein